MKNRIDLSNFNIHTDLVIDNEIYNNHTKKRRYVKLNTPS